MTHVIYLGLNDYQLKTAPVDNYGSQLQRVVFPPYKYCSDEAKQKKKGEQELCFTQVICTESNTFLIDYQQELWAFGTSQSGQIGIQSQSVANPINISQIVRAGIKYISSGHGFVVAYTTTKKLYLWGNIQQLKYDNFIKSEKVGFSEYIDTKYELMGLDLTIHFSTQTNSRHSYVNPQADIQGIKCHNLSTYLLIQDKVISLSEQIKSPLNIVGVACSNDHTLIWDRDGFVYSWGLYQDGRLGYMEFDESRQHQPRLVEGLTTRIVQCVCAEAYSIALDVLGDVYTWGKGPFKMNLVKAIEPSKMVFQRTANNERITETPNKPIVKIMAGNQHFGALTLDGKLWGWGLNHKMCLHNLADENIEAQQLNINHKIIDANMGSTFTVFIIAANTNYVLPNLNYTQYTKHQHRRIQQQMALINERKSKIEQQLQNQPTLGSIESPTNEKEDPNVDKTIKILNKMKRSVNNSHSHSRQSKQQKFSFLVNEKGWMSQKQPIKMPIDPIQERLRSLENGSSVFLPVLTKLTTQQRKQIKTPEQDLEILLNNQSDVLKYQYIHMVKSLDENQLLYVLLDEHRKSDDLPQRKKTNIKQEEFQKYLKKFNLINK